jgi:CRISPR-associated protein Csd1
VILQALKEYYGRAAASGPGKVPPFGYSFEQVGHVLVLSKNGEPIALEALPDRRQLVPLAGRSSDIEPKFLWDNTSYVFGVSAKSKRSAREHAAFKAKHAKLLGESGDPALVAFLAFLRNWSPNRYESVAGHQEALDGNLVFQLEGQTGYLHMREAARRVWTHSVESKWGRQGRCLVTGKWAPIAQTHPTIGNVGGAQSSGAYIVSFNQEAFNSYNRKHGSNAPVSEIAAFEYTAALNTLLARNSPNKAQIAGATTVFWADSGKPGQAILAEGVVAALIDPPDRGTGTDPQIDQQESAKVRTILEAIAKGRPLEEAAPEIDAERTRIFILGLSPNNARLSVRFWHQSSLGGLAERFRQHWQDLNIEPVPWTSLPSVRGLLLQTAPDEAAANIPSNLAGETMRAILSGEPYPRSLFIAAIMRCRFENRIRAPRSERAVYGMRAAILKACLIRAGKGNAPVSLDRDSDDTGYRLGRLFAMLESVRKAAVFGPDLAMRSQFFGRAPATPGLVFPLLMRKAGHQLAKMRHTGRPGLAAWFETEIGEIAAGLKSGFPETLPLDDQGRFVIGYYQQRFARKTDAPAGLSQEDTLNGSGDTGE